ncbi:MAG: HAD-IC family P-type ATPase, partial [Clostridia bacterium]|nr:HAD-IC family P-type ATPase [Clostridia bacterium]
RETEMGRIAGMIEGAAAPETPLQRRLAQLGAILVGACLLVSAAVFGAGVWQGRDPYLMFFTGVGLAVAAIPEGLPAIVTIALALGVQRMIRAHAIVRRLPAVETLGCATVICCDKTDHIVSHH